MEILRDRKKIHLFFSSHFREHVHCIGEVSEDIFNIVSERLFVAHFFMVKGPLAELIGDVSENLWENGVQLCCPKVVSLRIKIANRELRIGGLLFEFDFVFFNSEHIMHEGCVVPRMSDCRGEIHISFKYNQDRGAGVEKLILINLLFELFALQKAFEQSL